VPGRDPTSSLSCTNCPTPEARPTVTSIYEGLSDIGGCKHTDRITVSVDNDANKIVIAPAHPHIICEPDTVQVEADIFGPKPLTNLTCGLQPQLPATQEDTVEAIPPTAFVVQNL